LNRRKLPAALRAGRGTVVIAAAAAALMVSWGAAPASAGGLAPHAASGPAAGPVAPQDPVGQVFLITGDRILTRPGVTGLGAILAAPGDLSSGEMTAFGVGGTSYDIPRAALPFLGHGLDLSLFEPQLLLAAERDGRLPVRVGYHQRVPVLPGVTITRSGGGTAFGYLTNSSARIFEAALDHQQAADQADATGGTGGMFADGTTIGLATAVPLVPSADPELPMHAVTVKATNLSGQPDTGGAVQVFNVTNTSLGTEGALFSHGEAKFSLPAGSYFALGSFSPAPQVERTVVLPQFTVTGNTTVTMRETSADSKFTVVTPRRAAPAMTDVWFLRSGASGPPFVIEGAFPGRDQVWLSPTHARPTVGTLRFSVNQQLESPPGVKIPYQYTVSFTGPPGAIPAQRHVLGVQDLATIHERFYQPATTTGTWAFNGSFPGTSPNDNQAWFGFIGPEGPELTLPGQLTEYAGGTGTAQMEWSGQYQAAASTPFVVETPRLLRPGQQLTDDWSAYPLHPGADQLLTTLPEMFSADGATLPSAVRTGNTLQLQLDPFDDSAPGHMIGWVQAKPGAGQATGTYRISQDGRTIASGNAVAAAKFGSFYTTATLSPRPSTIEFMLSYARVGQGAALPAATTTVWTWRSAPEPGEKLPPAWTCVGYTYGHRDCAAQPMLVLRYAVANLSLRDAAPAGRQAIHLTVGHIQPATGSAITKASVSVSFDGGGTWQPARVSGCGGSYTASFTAPAGTTVSLRTSAADAAGGTITETITGAYQVAR
jgi:hypothetical protein